MTARLLVAFFLVTLGCDDSEPNAAMMDASLDDSDAQVFDAAAADPQDASPSGVDAHIDMTPDTVTPLSRVEEIIRADSFPRLVVEVDSVAGFEPRGSTDAAMDTLLTSLLDKPSGVEVIRDGTIVSRGSDYAWTDDDLFALADEEFDLAVGSDTIKLHVMSLDGHSARDSGQGVVLGLAWSNTHLVIFKDTIEDGCSDVLFTHREAVCRQAEETVWTHELGHLLGLVDNGLPMVDDHRDYEHGAHDENEDCVMYWAVEGAALFDSLLSGITGGGDPPTFDAACLADIAAVRDGP